MISIRRTSKQLSVAALTTKIEKARQELRTLVLDSELYTVAAADSYGEMEGAALLSEQQRCATRMLGLSEVITRLSADLVEAQKAEAIAELASRFEDRNRLQRASVKSNRALEAMRQKYEAARNEAGQANSSAADAEYRIGIRAQELISLGLLTKDQLLALRQEHQPK